MSAPKKDILNEAMPKPPDLPRPVVTVQNGVTLALFGLLSIVVIMNHEPWRDEAQAWLISRDSQSLSELFHWMGYEGTPALWHLLLYPFAQAGLPYGSMAVIHLLLSVLSAFLLLSFSPFSQTHKTLAVFGYFLFFEYNVIARSYVLVLVFLFLVASLYRYRFSRPVVYALPIALLANTTVHSLVIAGTLALAYLWEIRKADERKWASGALCLMFAGCIVSLLQILPPADLNPITASWHLDLSARNLGGFSHAVLGAFVPIPQWKTAFWNTRLFYALTPTMAILGIPVFLLSLCYFLRKPIPLFIYLLSNTGLFAIIFLKHRGSLRHHGLIFILFLFCIWIAHQYSDSRTGFFRTLNGLTHKTLMKIFTIILSLHLVAAGTAIFFELKYDFSAARKAAEYLSRNGLDNERNLVAAFPAYAAAPVLPFLTQIRKFYYLEYEDLGSFLIWNRHYALNAKLPIDQIVARVEKSLKNGSNGTYLILNKKIDNHEGFLEAYELMAYFDETIVPEESLFIYRLKLSPQSESGKEQTDLGASHGGKA